MAFEAIWKFEGIVTVLELVGGAPWGHHASPIHRRRARKFE